MRLLAVAVSCLCVFDFDLTLRIIRGNNQDTPAPDAKKAIQICQSNGCQIGIASANGNADKLKHVLSTKIEPSLFTEAFFNSPAFQYGKSDKSISLNALQSFTGTRTSCIIFFDDQWYNKQYADRTGASFIKADPSIGVSMSDVNQGLSILKKNKCIK